MRQRRRSRTGTALTFRPHRPKVVAALDQPEHYGRGFAGITFAEAASSRHRQSLRHEAQGQEQPMDTVLALFKSRKFWASVAGLLLIVLQAFIPDFPLDAEQVTNVIYVVVAFIIGTGLESASVRPQG